MWSISPFAAEAAADTTTFYENVRFTDCTLRDGEQQAGIVFNRADKIAIARELDKAGVYEIEAGTPVISEDDRAAIEEIVEANLKAKISALARARHDDVDLVAATGAWGVRISLPISPIQRASKIHLSDKEYLHLALDITGYAKSLNLTCIFSPYDTTRSDLPFLRKVIAALAREGTADRVRIVDTTGCATPQVIRFLVRQMKEVADIPIEIHCHNDFGLAVANTIAGAEAGAEYLSVTVNGIGERSGNASFEEAALALKILYGVEAGIDASKLLALSQLVEERSGVRLQDHKAVVGRGAFAHEAGMVVAGLLKDPFTAEAYSPELVGQRRRIVLGKKSGLVSVQSKLAELSISATQEEIKSLLSWVKQESVRTKSAITDEVFRARAEQIIHNK
jgi:isopropylmalate/homocitrate/citramalate synthase